MKKQIILLLALLAFACSNEPETVTSSPIKTRVTIDGIGPATIELDPPTAECNAGQNAQYCCRHFGGGVMCYPK